MPYHDLSVARILVDRLADLEDKSFHTVLFPASVNVKRAESQSRVFCTSDQDDRQNWICGWNLSELTNVSRNDSYL